MTLIASHAVANILLSQNFFSRWEQECQWPRIKAVSSLGTRLVEVQE